MYNLGSWLGFGTHYCVWSKHLWWAALERVNMRVTNAAVSLRGHAADGTLSELLSPRSTQAEDPLARYTSTLPSSINTGWLTTFRWLTLFLNESEGGGVIRRLSGLVLEGKTDKPGERQREMGISQRCWLPLISTDKASLWCSVKCKIKMRQKPRGERHPLLQLKTRGFFSLLSGSSPVRLSLKSARC